MKLGQILLKNRRTKWRQIKGNKTGGKYRVPYLFSEAHRKEFVEGLTEEAKNEMYLTRPFLNKHQELKVKVQFRKEFRGGRSLLTHDNEERELEEMRYKAEMRPSVKLSDVWKHVEDTKPWVERDHTKYNEPIYWREAEAVIPRKYPHRFPHFKENWAEWNKIEGFGLNKEESAEVVNYEDKN